MNSHTTEENKDSLDYESNETSEFDSQNEKRIFVFIRIRPFIPSELQIDKTTPFKSIDTKNNILTCKIFL